MKKATILVLLVLMAACSQDPRARRDKFFASGQKYLEAKKYNEAAIQFRNALQLDMGHIPSYLGISKAFQQMGEDTNAVVGYQKVLRLDGGNVPAKLALGEYSIIAGGKLAKAPEALSYFLQAQKFADEVLKVEPSNVDALILSGDVGLSQNEADKAIPPYEKALSLDPGNLRAKLKLAASQLLRKDAVKAEALLKEALQQHPNEIQAYIAIGAFYADARRQQEAESYLRKAFDMAPSDHQCLKTLATFYMSMKRNLEAENVFKEAIARKPKDREPRWGLAAFYRQLEENDKSIAALQELLKVIENDRESLLKLAEIYLGKNDESKAEQQIKILLAANKDDAIARFFQGYIYKQRRESDKAMTEFEAAIKFDAGVYQTRAYLEKANILLQRGDMESCDTTLKEVLQRNRNDLAARGAYAKLLVLRQHPKEALEQAQEVLSTRANDDNALYARAEALRVTGKLSDSRIAWEKLCQLQPKNFDYLYKLGCVEVQAGNKLAALLDFHKVLELYPSYINAINDILYLHFRDKQYDAAIAELDRLEKSSCPKDEISRFRGLVLLDKGDIGAAEVEFNKAIQENPKNYQCYIELAKLNIRRNNIAQAIKKLDLLISQNDKIAHAYFEKAFYLAKLNDRPGAIANYKKALALDAENAIGANNLAWQICESNTDLDAGLVWAQTAKRKRPEDPEIAETLGWVYYKMKNYTLAADQLLFSVNNRRQPEAENYYRLGMAYYGKGDRAMAKQMLEKALNLGKPFPEADEARKIIKERG